MDTITLLCDPWIRIILSKIETKKEKFKKVASWLI